MELNIFIKDSILYITKNDLEIKIPVQHDFRDQIKNYFLVGGQAIYYSAEFSLYLIESELEINIINKNITMYLVLDIDNKFKKSLLLMLKDYSDAV